MQETKVKLITGEIIVIHEVKPTHNTPLLKNDYQRWLICGSSGTGKTMSLFSLLDFLMIPDVIFILGAGLSKKATYITLVDRFKNSNVIFIEDASEMKEKLNKDELEETTISNIIIVDDLSNTEMKNEEIIKLFGKGRHGHLNSILITQNPIDAPMTIRRNLTGIGICGGSIDTTPLHSLVRGVVSKKKFDALYQKTMIPDEFCSNPFMWVSFENIPGRSRFRKNFIFPAD